MEYKKKRDKRMQIQSSQTCNVDAYNNDDDVNLLLERIKLFSKIQNNSEDIKGNVQAMIAGGVAPSVISGKLGHGTCSSGFINEKLYGTYTDLTVSVFDC
jgi:hypothetical protein